jgi:hypothetical protein
MSFELFPRSPSSGFRYFKNYQLAADFVQELHKRYPSQGYGTHAVIVERDDERPVEVNYFIGSCD